jgi:hypothetical protein
MSNEGDPKTRKSVDSFRRAGTAVGDGIRTLYESSRVWLGRRHSVARFAVAAAVWFAGNWTHNRIAPSIVRIAKVAADRLSFAFAVGPVVTFFEGNSVLLLAQFLTVLVAAVVARNRIRTQKRTGIENNSTIMATTPRKATDGGSRKLPPTGGRAIGGAIAGVPWASRSDRVACSRVPSSDS